jgi:hypothetical protein
MIGPTPVFMRFWRRNGYFGALHPVGEQQYQPFQLSFNPSLKVDFQGSRVTSDGGLLLVRELDERLGLSELISEHLTDSRAKNTQLPLADLLRQSIYSRMAGYEDMNDAERLAQDPSAPWKGAGLQRVQVPPGNWFAPPGSSRSSSGGNEAAEAFDGKGRYGDLASVQAVT